MTRAVIELTGVSVTTGGLALPTLRDIDLSLAAGEVLVLVGPNGAGKSTLLSVFTGDRRPDRGRVDFDGAPLVDHHAGTLARRRSVLLQSNDVSFPFTVREVVAMGRAPWRGRPEADEDEAQISRAMVDGEVAELAGRRLPELSGGERARVSFARTRSQACHIVMLDEPTASLDIRHQERVLALMRDHARQGGSALVVLHDLSLAAAYADRIAVLGDGALLAVGAPDEVLTAELLSSVYRYPVAIERSSTSGALLVLPLRDQLAPTETKEAAHG